MAPGMPAILEPIITEPRTTTVKPRPRHQSRLDNVHKHEPARHHDQEDWQAALGTKKIATSTGGIHEMNGPKKGWLQDAREAAVTAYTQAKSRLAAIGNGAVDHARESLAAQETANDRDTLCSSSLASSVYAGGTRRKRKLTILSGRRPCTAKEKDESRLPKMPRLATATPPAAGPSARCSSDWPAGS